MSSDNSPEELGDLEYATTQAWEAINRFLTERGTMPALKWADTVLSGLDLFYIPIITDQKKTYGGILADTPSRLQEILLKIKFGRGVVDGFIAYLSRPENFAGKHDKPADVNGLIDAALTPVKGKNDVPIFDHGKLIDAGLSLAYSNDSEGVLKAYKRIEEYFRKQ